MRKQFKNLVILVLVILTGVIIYFRYWSKGNPLNILKQDQQTSTPKLKTFKSEKLDFIVQIPEHFSVEESRTIVDFRSGNKFIDLGRSDASGLGNLNSYLADLDEKNETEKVLNSKAMEINGYPSMMRIETRGGVTYKIYYLYVDDWVYIFSTKSESLYPDLDQIVKSFRYTP